MPVRIIHADAYRRVRWKNGLGWTREIASGWLPERSRDDIEAPQLAENDWDWRVSIAEVDRDCPFSAFPDVDRTLVLLEGAGMHLRFGNGESVTLSQPIQRIDFAGEQALECQLIAGPTRDFNAMWRRDRVCARIECASIRSRETLSCGRYSVVVVLAVSGDLHVHGDAVESVVPPGDAAVIQSGDERGIALVGNAQIVIVRFDVHRPG